MNNTTNRAADTQLADNTQQNVLINQFKLGGIGCVNILDAMTQEPEPLDEVFAGVIAKTVGMIAAAGATGKGFVALGIVTDLATGKNNLGLDIPEVSDDQGAIRLITLEDPIEVLNHRVHSLGSLFNEGDRIKIARRVHIESLAGQIHHLIDTNGNVNHRLLTQMCHEMKGSRLIILDTLRRFHAGNENDSGHMSTLITCFEVIANQTGAAVIFLHHVSKGAELNSSSSQSSSRGATAITDNIRAQFNMTKMSEDEAEQYSIPDHERFKYVSIINSKTNYTESKPALWLKRGIGGVLSAHKFVATFGFNNRNGAKK